MVPPARFIPLLERTGLIATLTSRMLDHAIGFAAQLRAAGIACPVSVNVSVQDLLEPNLVGKFERALRRHGAHPEDIKIELTETSFSEGKEGVNDTLDRLHDLGIRSSIDDFGTGYASLTYLSQFAVNEVKIDRMFVDNMSTNPRDRAIVRATIGMAHDMALTVTAEGAEDEETLEALREEGCDHVQGYVISKPLASKEMSAFADARGRRL